MLIPAWESSHLKTAALLLHSHTLILDKYQKSFNSHVPGNLLFYQLFKLNLRFSNKVELRILTWALINSCNSDCLLNDQRKTCTTKVSAFIDCVVQYYVQLCFSVKIHTFKEVWLVTVLQYFQNSPYFLLAQFSYNNLWNSM